MGDKNIFSKLTLQTQTKYKNTNIKTCWHGLLPWVMLKIYPAWFEVSDYQSLDIREVTIASVWQNNT